MILLHIVPYQKQNLNYLIETSRTIGAICEASDKVSFWSDPSYKSLDIVQVNILFII